MADMRISELTTAAGLHDGDLFETSQTDSISSSGYASYKTSLSAIAAFIAKQVQYSGDLQTTSKTLIGAINEVFNAGTSVTVTNVLPATETTKRVATITVDGVAKDINADDTVKVITDLKTPKNATITNGIAQFECIEGNLVKGLKLTMNPIQDLHGYDSPWAGGAGKNKLDVGSPRTNVNGNVTYVVKDDGTVTVNGQASSTNPSTMGFSFTLSAGTYTLSGCPSGGSDLTYRMDITGLPITAPLEYGNGVTFTLTQTETGTARIRLNTNYNAQNLVFKPMIEVGSTKTSYAPYSNICPISGRTEASVTRTGKNQLDDTNSVISGANMWYYGNGNTYKFWKAGTYTFSYEGNSATTYYTLQGGSNTTIITTLVDGRYKGNFTLAQDGYYRFFTQKQPSISADDVKKPMITSSTADQTYTAYQVETHTHQYSETIYGGVDDFVNGGLSNEWGYITSYDGETLPGEWISDRDVYAPDTTPTTGAEVAYKLSTPTTISTSAEEITTVSGTNIISGTEPISECQYTELATVDDLIKIIGGQ